MVGKFDLTHEQRIYNSQFSPNVSDRVLWLSARLLWRFAFLFYFHSVLNYLYSHLDIWARIFLFTGLNIMPSDKQSMVPY